MIFILGGVGLLAVIIIIAMAASGGSKPPPQPVPPPVENQGAPGNDAQSGPSAEEKLDDLITEAQNFAKAKPTDFNGQLTRWKKARTEAVTQRSPKAKEIQAEIDRLRDRK